MPAPATAIVSDVYVPVAVTLMFWAPAMNAAPISASVVCLIALIATDGPMPSVPMPGDAVAVAS